MRQRMLVVNVGRRRHRAVSQPGLAVDPEVELHAEMPLSALAGLMHFGVARLLFVPGRTGRSDQGRIHDRAAIELYPTGLQNPAHLREELLAQLVLVEQMTKFKHRGRIGHSLAAQVDPHEAAQARAVVQRLLAGEVRQVGPVLDEVNPRHALSPDRRATVAALRIVRLDHCAQRRPWHDLVNHVEKLVAPRTLASCLESRSVIGCHRECLLLHRPLPFSLRMSSITHETYEWWNKNSLLTNRKHVESARLVQHDAAQMRWQA